ncbi:chitotriosidase-1-like [Belonocnema kinseyi]|uniref:chitotriosidase-1-like n=1 Tax=Belonocnema kinseyi TaxID=2817044 RepID=UPI00143D2FAC|nr:chitotriosidase-1-like [Belonocnema kinseyi]
MPEQPAGEKRLFVINYVSGYPHAKRIDYGVCTYMNHFIASESYNGSVPRNRDVDVVNSVLFAVLYDQTIGCYYNIKLSDDSYGIVLDIEDIDVSLCTHLIYSFVGLGKDASIQTLDDIQNDEFTKFNDLRKKNPHLNTLISLPDTNDDFEHTITNNKILTDPNLRETLVDNIVNFLQKYGFNGVDIDLSYAKLSGGVSPIKENSVLLLKALREKSDEEDFILSVAVDPTEDIARILYDIKEIATYVNFINLKTYNFHGISKAGKKVDVAHTSPHYPSSNENQKRRKMNIDDVVQYWISEGAPARKLILGIPFYGISYTLANPKQISRDTQFTEEVKMGSQLQYYQICSLAKDPKWMHFYDKKQQVPYVFRGNQIIAYDDVKSIKKKAEYVEKMNLGGVSVWTINQDDLRGQCGETFPLLKTLNRAIRQKCGVATYTRGHAKKQQGLTLPPRVWMRCQFLSSAPGTSPILSETQGSRRRKSKGVFHLGSVPRRP